MKRPFNPKALRWCPVCKQHKPVTGSKMIRPGTYKCADCVKEKP